MTSVIVAAHNEASVVRRCLDTLLSEAAPGELEVIVVANGCADDTAARALRPGIQVIELATAGKAAALNAGDDAATRYPRIYLDADMRVTTADIRALSAVLEGAGCATLAAYPQRTVALEGRPLAVRAFYAINTRLPAFDGGLFGRGLVALSEAGRARFARFPDLIADDLFLDSLFSEHEKRLVADVTVVVEAPRRTSDLVSRLVRVRRGNAAMRTVQSGVRVADRWSWLRDVVVPRPWLVPAGVIYAGISAYAAWRASASAASREWERDASTR
ncbi:glycosyltransferase involved in cell wall biosynthesis [Phycicoccus badiiscoriae]|uniref:4,4'-diaponeurosporenoate glycosyltransferase n=1 Tax=Pedococcus badiiscoriae TaxID=642776 RepID=A0A852WPX6_9MICO|nr:glycosyltransferase [Pedococcus badiiscoriae]NYG07396.1 glycosyltransferase involved in cell wall biosynthesis [Pedococcus badiiscoriae]